MENLVTLGDASLTTEDLALLVPPAWLNDNLISFWCEHLRIDVLQNHAQAAILPPNVTFLIANTNDDDDLSQIASAHQLKDKQMVLATVNNSRDRDISSAFGPAGSHWSLLIFYRPENTVFYLDSMTGTPNLSISRLLSRRLSRMVAAPSATIETMSVPKQTNSYDCGAFVCVFAETAVHRFLKSQSIASMYASDEPLEPGLVDATRQQIGKLACRLFDAQQNTSKIRRATTK